MNNDQMRNALLAAYSSARWSNKVKLMKDDQVQAIYFRLKNQGVIK